MKQLHVVHLTLEMAPFAKVGGLADVVESLPRALHDLGHRITVIVPRYGFLFDMPSTALGERTPEGQQLFELNTSAHPGRILLLDDPRFRERSGIYADPERGEEYPDTAAGNLGFVAGCLECLATLDATPPDIVHVHDHQTALAPSLLRRTGIAGGFYSRSRSVLTIHNLGYQGVYEASALERPGVDSIDVTDWPLDFHGQINFLKAGIVDANAVTTVSPRYSREILTPEFGAGLDGILAARPGAITGILNGIDTSVWNPGADPLIPAPYSQDDLSGKVEARRALLARTGLSGDADRPLVGMVTRLTEQKGFDLVLPAAQRLMDLGVGLVVLGSGDPGYEAGLAKLASASPQDIFHSREFDEPLAHLIQAGSDLFLVPSRYEPCGLTQMIAMRYGTVPVVRAVGGLADTVRPVQPEGGGTGFLFTTYSVEALLEAVEEALALRTDGERWREVQREGMGEDFSWNRASEEYVRLYQSL